MGEIKVLLVAGPGLSRDAYERRLTELNAEYDAIDGFDEIEGRLTETLYNGLLLDVPTMIHSSVSGKAKTHALFERYPVLRIIYDASADEIRGLAFGHTVREGQPLKDFITKVCPKFEPRSIRLTIRREVAISVYVLDSPDMDISEADKSVLFNICQDGVFLFSVEPMDKDEALWLRIVDNPGLGTMKAVVRWSEPWGRTGKIPGLGLEFTDLSEDQQAEIKKICGTEYE